MRVYNVATNSLSKPSVEVKQPRTLAILSHAVDASVPCRMELASEVATQYGATCLWEFSLCIDHTSNSDIDRAATECYSRLKNAHVCLVYLHDLPTLASSMDEQAWRSCRYWTRAWPLAEFVVPKRVEIFDCQWNHRGSKGSTELLALLSDITTIPKGVLQYPETILNIPADKRISWGSKRLTTRPEDVAYALMPVLGITIPTCYGEGAHSAFLRLQREFLRQSFDASILFWKHNHQEAINGLLAQSPAEFSHLSETSESNLYLTHSTPREVSDDETTVMDSQERLSPNQVPIDELSIRPKEEFSRDLSEWDSHRPSTFMETSGIKRKRSGSPAIATDTCQNLPYNYGESINQGESRWDDVISDSDTDSECSCHCHSQFYDNDEEEPENLILDPAHELHQLRPDFVEFARGSIRQRLKGSSYSAPPDDRLPPRKRFRTTSWSPSDDKPSQAALTQDQGTTNPPEAKGYFHLACPFYIHNPKRYQSCLLQHDLQSIEHVIKHVSEHHTEPPYCPICRQEFERAFTRDIHVRARTCTPATGDVDGVNDRQKRMLVRKDRVQRGERGRWRRIWRTIFPHTKPGDNPYLDGGLGRDVSILRDYWESQGDKIITDFLSTMGKANQFESQDIKAFSETCLEDLLKKLVEDYDLDSYNDGTT